MVTKLIIIMLCVFFLGVGVKYIIVWYKIPKDRDGRRGNWLLLLCSIGLPLMLSYLVGRFGGELLRLMGG